MNQSEGGVERYQILPPASQVHPASTFEELVDPASGIDDDHHDTVSVASSDEGNDATTADATPSTSEPANPLSRQPGQSTSTAILIDDSPTPPLRPVASSHARSEAAAQARSPERRDEQDDDAPKTILSELTCPICMGPPVPLVVTECGHCFCGPCLHSSLTTQTITLDLLRAIPTIAGKDLEGTCPVCRHPLLGGWGKSIRGAVLRYREVDVAV